MKKSVLFSFFLFLALWQIAKAAEPDTVWTKNIWPEEVKTVMFSPDGAKIYVSTNDGIVNIYDTMTGFLVDSVKGVGEFRHYSPDKKFIYTSGLRKLDAGTFKVLATYDSIPKDMEVDATCLTGDTSITFQ